MKRVTKLIILTVVWCGLLEACTGHKIQGKSSSNTPSGVVTSYYNALKSGDYQKAVSFVNCKPEEKPEIMTLMQYSTGMNGGIESYSIVSEEINKSGDTAHIVVKTHFNDIDVSESHQKLVKVNDNWRILVI